MDAPELLERDNGPVVAVTERVCVLEMPSPVKADCSGTAVSPMGCRLSTSWFQALELEAPDLAWDNAEGVALLISYTKDICLPSISERGRDVSLSTFGLSVFHFNIIRRRWNIFLPREA